MGLMDKYKDNIRRCTACHKGEGDLPPSQSSSATAGTGAAAPPAGGERLKKCAKCEDALYCSRACQRRDWKAQKARCGKSTAQQVMADELDCILAVFHHMGQLAPGKAPKVLRDATYLNNLSSEREAFERIVDSYRMRVEDEWNFRGLSGGEDHERDFGVYLDIAERKGGVLPSWWTAEKREECERLGRDTNGGCCLQYSVTKADIQKKYKEELMPMRLRMIAQMVTGEKVGGG